MSTRHWTALLRMMMQPQVVSNAVRVSLFVGTSLNAINQGAHIWREDGVDWGSILLNYAVPYLVSSYSAARPSRLR